MEALSNPTFYLGGLAVFITLLVGAVSRNTKKLFYDVYGAACENPIADAETHGDAETEEQDSKGTETRLLVIDLRNPSWGIFSWLGGVDIAASDYDRQISIQFGESARVLEVEVVEEKPPGIGAEVFPYHYPPDTLVLKPVLLNQGDLLRLRVLVENPEWERLWVPIWTCKVRISGRILGIKKIIRVWDDSRWFAYGLLTSLSAVAVSTIRNALLFVMGRVMEGQGVAPTFGEPETGSFLILALLFFSGAETALVSVGFLMILRSLRKRRRGNRLLKQYRE